ncbi:MAG: PD-(D/E)XK motif protein [Thermoplasmatales archaeon]
MTDSPELIEWEYLERDPPKYGSFTARIAFPSIDRVVMAAIDSEMRRHILIPLPSNEEDLTDNRSRGVSVNTEILQVRGNKRDLPESRYIDIKCMDSAAQEVFDLFGRQIAIAVANSNVSRKECVLRTLAKWRYFWGRTPVSRLSESGVIGLFTELWFLSKWLMPYASKVKVISSWRGPFGSRHDYEWQGVSVEVKGTTSVEGVIHWINGIDQLVPPENGKLFLFSMQLREENGGPHTLTNIINECRTKIGSEQYALESFDTALSLTGYSPTYDEDYSLFRFRVVKEELYEVIDSFPRITPDVMKNGVPSGVIDINYKITLDGFDRLAVAKAPGQNTASLLMIPRTSE